MNRIARRCFLAVLFTICGFSFVMIFGRGIRQTRDEILYGQRDRNSTNFQQQVVNVKDPASGFVISLVNTNNGAESHADTRPEVAGSVPSTVPVLSSEEVQTVYLGENLLHESDYLNLGIIFTKVSGNGILKHKFQTLLRSIMKNTRSPLHIHLITDEQSLLAAQHITNMLENQHRVPVKVSPYFVQDIAQQTKDVITVMQQYFSAKPGAYYADVLFFLSLVFYQVAPPNLDRIVFIDVDCKVVTDVRELFDHFSHFQSEQVIGLAHELTPVYRHVLYSFRSKHNATLFGEPHGRGFPGFNSGVILMDLNKLRQSSEYSSLLSKTVIDVLAAKYSFKGHLGDQDFFTLTGFEYPELYYLLPCGWNRQLCRWWENRGYEDVFQAYFECSDKTKVFHANCNSEFPES